MLKAKNGFFETQCLFVCDQLTSIILDVNDVALNRLGYEKQDLVGSTFTKFTQKVNYTESINGVQKGLDRLSELWKINTQNGEQFYAQFSSQVISYKNKLAKFIIAHEVSLDDSVESEKSKSISKPFSIVNSPLAEIEWTPDRRILRWSSKAQEMFGWTEDELRENPSILDDFAHPADFEAAQNTMSEASLDKLSNVSIVTENVTKDGRLLHCEWHNSLLYDEAGNLVSLYSTVQDISARLEISKKLKRSIRSYLELFNSISDAIYLLNEEGVILEANEGINHVFGYKFKEVVGQHFKILGAPGKLNHNRFKQLFEEAEPGAFIKYEGWGRKKNGEVFPSEVSANVGSYFGEKVLIIIERDISQRKEFEENSKTREVLFNELFNTTPIGIALLNNHKEIEMINKGFERIFGYKEKEIVGLELDKVIVSEEFYDEARIMSESNKAEEYVGVRRTKKGKLVDVLIYAVPVLVDGKTIAIYGIYVDISDRKRAEERLIDSLKEKEVMLAEIHHRVKNNLAVITGLLELQSYNTPNESAQRILRDSQMRINSIALVHEKLYQSENLSEIKIHNYIKELSTVIQRAMGTSSIPIEVSFDLDNVSVVITQAIPCGLLLNEILTNCYKHAFKDAKSGRIWVSFKEINNELVFILKDNGNGFPEEDLGVQTKSLGMTLIRTLGKQLNADTLIKNDNGAFFSFSFRKAVH